MGNSQGRTPAAESQALADIVRQGRERLGLTQTGLAEALGMSQRWVSDVERGVIKSVRRTTMDRLAQTLQVPVADIVIAVGQARTSAEAGRVIELTGEVTAKSSMSLAWIDTSELPPERRLQELISLARSINWESPGRFPFIEGVLRGWRQEDVYKEGGEDHSA